MSKYILMPISRLTRTKTSEMLTYTLKTTTSTNKKMTLLQSTNSSSNSRMLSKCFHKVTSLCVSIPQEERQMSKSLTLSIISLHLLAGLSASVPLARSLIDLKNSTTLWLKEGKISTTRYIERLYLSIVKM